MKFSSFFCRRAYKKRLTSRTYLQKQAWIITPLFIMAGLISAHADVYIGTSGSTETKDVAGVWSVDGGLFVGASGTGTLNIEQAGYVSSWYGIVGSRGTGTGGTGTVTVRSAWVMSSGGNLFVGMGSGGNGTLNIEEGGYVINTIGYVASWYANDVGTGTVMVSGTWENRVSLSVGYSGTGTLNINLHGVVVSPNGVVFGEINTGKGLLNFGSGGTLVTSSLSKGSGSALLTFNGGTLRATGNHINYLSNFASSDVTLASGGVLFDTNGYNIGVSTDLSGEGGLTKSGSGMLTLSGSNSYEGGTIVRSGTLEVNGSIAHNDANTVVGDESGDDGTLVVKAGASISARYSYLGSGSNSIGSARVSGTWANSRSLLVGYFGVGTLDISDNGYVSGSYGMIGVNASSSGSAAVSGTWVNTGNVLVGVSGTGILDIKQGGYLSGSFGVIGANVGSSGSAQVSGTWVNTDNVLVGQSGVGALHLKQGGFISGSFGIIGWDVGSSGSAQVSGTWVSAANFLVGQSGTGSLVLEKEGYISGSNGIIAWGTASSGSAQVSGTWINSRFFSVAQSGTGVLILEKGGYISTQYGIVGWDVTSSGSAMVSGTWVNSKEMYVGDFGTGVLNIKDGGYISNEEGVLGGEEGSSGSVFVSGTWVTSKELKIGNYGTGLLNIEDGGVVSGSSVTIGAFGTASGTLNLNSGGLLITGQLTRGEGSAAVNLNGGTLRATGDNSTYLSSFASSDVTLISGGVIFDTNGYNIGVSMALSGSGGLMKSGSGTLTLSGSNSYEGGTTIRSGTLFVNSVISHTSSDTVVSNVNRNRGTLIISASGVVLGRSGILGDGEMEGPYASLSTGTAIVSGSWVNSGTMIVGLSGTGTLDIEKGGYVSNQKGYVGHNYYSTGTANVSGTWINNGELAVGPAGAGTLNIKQGGYVYSEESSLGRSGTGNVTVSGTWVNQRGVWVYRGNLNIEEGGYVSSNRGYLGVAASSSGTATVSGTWSNPDYLLVGFSGTGTLNIEQGGLVVSATETRLGTAGSATGVLNLNTGGTLETAYLSKGEGKASLNFNGGTLRANQNNDTYLSNFAEGDVSLASGGVIFDTNGYAIGVSTALSGSGGLTKSGSGTLTLSGSSNYTGATNVAGGTLKVNGGLHGGGDLRVESGGTLSGTGVVSGAVTIKDGGILSAGKSPGTLSLGSLVLSSGAISNFELGTASDLVAVMGNLTLGGVLNITGITGFANGSYTLFSYGGELVDNPFTLNLIPEGWNLSQFAIDLSTDGYVKLLVDSAAGQYWDGANTTAHGAPSGGDGVWSSAGTNWTNFNGSLNTNWQGGTAIFGGSSGAVTVADAVSFKKLQFETDGYTIQKGSGFLVASGTSELYAAANVGAEISAGIGQSGTAAIVKTGSGTVVLSGSNSYSGGTIVKSGTLAVNSVISHTAADVVVGSIEGDRGSFVVNTGAAVSSKGGIIGSGSNSFGAAVVSGSWTNTGDLTVGERGSGSLEIEQGGSLSNAAANLGNFAGSSGIVTVSGSWVNSSGLTVGNNGVGELIIKNGGYVAASSAIIGRYASGNGTATVSGTLVTTGSLTIGNLGSGGLTIEKGGVVKASGVLLAVTGTSTRTLNLNSGSILETGELRKGSGAAFVKFDGGTLRATKDNAYYLSGFGSSNVTLASGGVTFDTNGYDIGVSTALSGAGGLTKSGSGTLTLSGSNSYEYATTVTGGTLILGGTGASIKHNFVATLLEANSDDATLVINAGASLSNGNAYVSSMGSQTATVVVGGTWVNEGGLLLGNVGSAVLTIEQSGYISSAYSYLGQYGNGSASVSGTWTTIGTLSLGYSGTASLTINQTGYVVNLESVLGGLTDSLGTAAVSGTWLSSGALIVGQSGYGSLDIENGGHVGANVVIIGSEGDGDGTVNLKSGGILVTSGITKGEGNASLMFDGGIVRATASNETYLSNFSSGDATLASGGVTFDTNGHNIGISSLTGSGGVTKSGSGSLNFTGSNTYTGATTVAAGTLKVNGGLYGGGSLTVKEGGTLGGTGIVTGSVTVEDGGILAAGNSPGTLTLGSLSLGSGAISNFELGSSSDLVAVTGNLTLGGVLNILAVTDFTNDTYTLFTYGGDLIGDHYFTLNLVPEGWNLAQFTIDLETPGVVKLLVDNSETIQYWDGSHTSAHGGPSGGDGVWNSAGTNWTNINGSLNTDWKGVVAVFSGSARTVSVADEISFTQLHFKTDGYTIEDNGGSLLATGTAQLHSATGVSAEITIGIGQTGTSAIVKTGSGTVVLSGSNSYSGGTVVRSGTLALNGSITHSAADTVLGGKGGDVATLAINNGATLANRDSILGLGSNATGLAVVSGTWVNSGTVYLGSSGDGTLDIESGGVVSTDAVVFGTNAGGAGALNLKVGATLITGGFSKGAGSASVTIEGGILRATKDNDQFFANFGSSAVKLSSGGFTFDTDVYDISVAATLSGSGGFTKSGSGSLLLTGSSSFSGGTKIAAGTLETSNQNALGSGQVALYEGATLKATGGLDIGGGFLWNGGTLELALGTNTDTIHITGALDNSGGGHEFVLYAGSGYAINTAYTLLTFGDESTFSLSDFTANVISDLGATFRLVDTGNTLQVIYLGAAIIDGSDVEMGEGTATPEVESIVFVDEGGSVVVTGTLPIVSGTITSGTGNATIVDGSLVTEEGFRIDNEGSLTITSTLETGTSGGGVVKTGSGTLVLLGSNGYTGNTRIEDGILSVAGDSNLGMGGDVELDGGILQARGSFDTNRDALLGENGGGIDVLSNQMLSWNGIIADGARDAGGLTKSGSGTLVLSHSNSYTGGTTIDKGRLRAENPNALGSGSVILNSGGTLDVATTLKITDFTWNGGGVISLSPQSGHFLTIDGALIKGTPGIFAFDFPSEGFDFNATYTLITFGTNSGFSLGDFSAPEFFGITPNFFFESDGRLAVRYLGASTGSVIENKGPTFTPSDANFVVSGTVATSGTSDSNTVNSLLFQNGSSLQVYNRLTVTAGSLTVIDGRAVVHGGEVYAPGDLTKSGHGMLISDGDLTAAGAAYLEAGALIVNGTLTTGSGVTVRNTALLGGSGYIVGNVTNYGVVSPGNSPGTLTVAGDYNQALHGAFLMEIAGKDHFDRLIVSGVATLSGVLEVISYGGYQLEYGQKFAFIKSTKIRGAFNEINLPTGLRGRILAEDGDATLLVAPESYTQLAQTPNQRNVASALDAFIGAQGDRDTVSIALDELSADEYVGAFNQIAPTFYESLANITIEQSNAQGQMLQQRFGAVRFGGIGSRGFSQIGFDAPIIAEKKTVNLNEGRDIMEVSAENPWGVWAQANGIFGKTSGVNDVRSYDTDSGGFLLGADYRWSAQFTTGLYTNYQATKSRYDGGGEMSINAARFGAYATLDAGNGFYANGLIGGGFSDYEVRRTIDFGSLNRTARSNPNGGEFTTMLGSGYDWNAGGFTFGPVASAQYTYVAIGGTTETGAKSLDLQLADQEAHSLRTTVGARIAYTWKLNENVMLTPEIRASWQHEFLQGSRTLNSILDGGSGPGFNYATTAASQDAFFAGAGFNLQLGTRWSANVYYNLNCGSGDFQSHMLSGGVNLNF